MMHKTIIRFVTKKDLTELVDLCKQHADFEKSEYDKKDKELLLKQHLFSDNPSLYCLVIEMDKKLIGYATYMKQFSTWDAINYVYMDCLFLSEKSRGLGLGEQLIIKIKEEALQLNCTLIQWQTPDFNKRAIKFYNRIGAVSKVKERFFLEL